MAEITDAIIYLFKGDLCRQWRVKADNLIYVTKSQIIKRSLIFSSLDEYELAELSELAIERSFESNEFVFWEGDAPDWF